MTYRLAYTVSQISLSGILSSPPLSMLKIPGTGFLLLYQRYKKRYYGVFLLLLASQDEDVEPCLRPLLSLSSRPC